MAILQNVHLSSGETRQLRLDRLLVVLLIHVYDILIIVYVNGMLPTMQYIITFHISYHLCVSFVFVFYFNCLLSTSLCA